MEPKWSKNSFDYLIVGAGLFGSTFAYEASKKGKKVLVIDKRAHVGGNIYCDHIEGINVHKYGAHIFHTNSKELWDYVNQFAEFNNYINSPLANYKGEIFNLPFNMNTFNKMWGVCTPSEARERIDSERESARIENPCNLEEQAISLVGVEIYEKLIRGYTKKQWGRDPKDLPAWIIKRLPTRFTYNNNYFSDRYQGIPIGGYNVIIDKMLENIEVALNCDYFEDRKQLDQIATKVLYTGKIDEFFDFKYGDLEYRGLKFEQDILDCENYQGNAVVNFTDEETPYTRILEHKHFEFGEQEKTVITKEYPAEATRESIPYYPVNNDKNNKLYLKYKQEAEIIGEKFIFGGRLAEYKYYDMHQVIASSLKLVEKEFGK